MNIKCSSHRLIPWLGHGECSEAIGGCGKLFKHLLAAGETCPSCKARLLPWGRLRVENLFLALEGRTTPLRAGVFTGRPMCPKCFEGRKMEGVPLE